MNWRHIGYAVALCLIATACSGGPLPKDPPPSSRAEDRPPPPPQAGPDQRTSPLPQVLAERATGDLERVTFTDGDTIAAEGAYFLNTTAANGDGWVMPSGPGFRSTYISDDNRFVIAKAGEHGYIIDRAEKALWRWDPTMYEARVAGASGALFTELQQDSSGNAVATGRHMWTGPDFAPQHVLEVGRVSSALISPDGQRLALLRWESASATLEVVLADLTTGDLKRLEASTRRPLTATGLEHHRGQFQVTYLVNVGSPMAPRFHTGVRRFTWQGEAVQEWQIPGAYDFFSPDGKWVAWEEWPLGDFTPVTVIADAATLQPHVTVLGTTTCFQTMASGGTRWLADSSGLVVDSTSGYRLLTLDGQLQALPAFAGLTWKGEPQPAPDHPDRFAVGRIGVVDGAGTRSLGIALSEHVTPASWAPWGNSSTELRFVLPPAPKGGACRERPAVQPVVLTIGERLPEHPLVLEAAAACANLRDNPYSGRVLECIPGGARLKPAHTDAATPGSTWIMQSWWLLVETETGLTGWLSLGEADLAWAEPVHAASGQ